jgi:hypothetical protein
MEERYIKISEEYNVGKDEKWCEWYRCPACKEIDITAGSKYCPQCGIKLNWK